MTVNDIKALQVKSLLLEETLIVKGSASECASNYTSALKSSAFNELFHHRTCIFLPSVAVMFTEDKVQEVAFMCNTCLDKFMYANAIAHKPKNLNYSYLEEEEKL